MKYFHGTKDGSFKTLMRNQAYTSPGVAVPELETRNAIYLTPSYEFALAQAVKTQGVTKIGYTGHRIVLDMSLYNPEQEVYVYEIDSEVIDSLPKEKITISPDGYQYVIDANELPILHRHVCKAEEVEQYYKLVDWKEYEREKDSGLKVK